VILTVQNLNPQRGSLLPLQKHTRWVEIAISLKCCKGFRKGFIVEKTQTPIMAMKNSLCRCRVLAKIATSQPATRRISPPLILLLQQSSCYSTNEKEHNPPTITLKKTPPLYKKLPSSTDFPRPKEIPFQAKVANSINLIGYIDMPIQTQVSSPDEKFRAATVITQEPSYHSPALRYSLLLLLFFLTLLSSFLYLSLSVIFVSVAYVEKRFWMDLHF